MILISRPAFNYIHISFHERSLLLNLLDDMFCIEAYTIELYFDRAFCWQGKRDTSIPNILL
jgi:hypothetical protein